MDKAKLKERGGFVSSAPVKREVTWIHISPDGEEMTDTFDIHVMSRSAGVMNKVRKLSADGMDEMALMISAFVRLGDKGQESISYEEAQELDDGLQIVMVSAINRHWSVRVDPKNSPPPTNSGTTSPDSSVAAPLLS